MPQGGNGIEQERRLVTEIPGPRSRELLARRMAAVPPAVFNTVPISSPRGRRRVVGLGRGSRDEQRCQSKCPDDSDDHTAPWAHALQIRTHSRPLSRSPDVGAEG